MEDQKLHSLRVNNEQQSSYGTPGMVMIRLRHREATFLCVKLDFVQFLDPNLVQKYPIFGVSSGFDHRRPKTMGQMQTIIRGRGRGSWRERGDGGHGQI